MTVVQLAIAWRLLTCKHTRLWSRTFSELTVSSSRTIASCVQLWWTQRLSSVCQASLWRRCLTTSSSPRRYPWWHRSQGRCCFVWLVVAIWLLLLLLVVVVVLLYCFGCRVPVLWCLSRWSVRDCVNFCVDRHTCSRARPFLCRNFCLYTDLLVFNVIFYRKSRHWTDWVTDWSQTGYIFRKSRHWTDWLTHSSQTGYIFRHTLDDRIGLMRIFWFHVFHF